MTDTGSHSFGGNPFALRQRLARAAWSVVQLLLFRPTPRPLHRWRNWLLRLFGAELHPTARVYPRARCWAPWNLKMARCASIGEDVDIYSVAPIVVGEYAMVSQYCFLCTASHDPDDPQMPLTTAPIVIGARSWVAADVFVGPGATIGEGAVVGARSSVFGEVEAWTIVAGNPLKTLRRRRVGPVDPLSVAARPPDRRRRTHR